jgi:hypothetical protein
MKEIKLNAKYSSVDSYRKLIQSSLDKLQSDNCKNKQKTLEVCHLGKLLLFLQNQYWIEKLFEEPDFIITNRSNRIGLEHQIIIDKEAKEKEGFFTNLCELAEKELQKDNSLPNFLANVYAHPSFNCKINDKRKIVNDICQLIRLQIRTGEVPENDIIDRIFSMKHSKISICANLGAWWQKEITGELIIDAIRKKETKINQYIRNTKSPQWLLLVIGSVGESSYRMGDKFSITVDTKFDKVFVLEDFYNRLFEIK